MSQGVFALLRALARQVLKRKRKAKLLLQRCCSNSAVDRL